MQLWANARRALCKEKYVSLCCLAAWCRWLLTSLKSQEQEVQTDEWIVHGNCMGRTG